MRPKKKIVFLAIFFAPGFLLASLIFFPADGRKKRDNPADQRATNYQGFASTSETQTLTVLNEGPLGNGETSVVELSNGGWKPLKYKLSTNAGFSDVPSWTEMPASRRLTYQAPTVPGTQTIYGAFLMSGNKELSASVSFAYFGRSVYVDMASGSDANAGTIPTKPVKTLVYALALASLSNVSNIFVTAGTYGRANGGLNATGDGLIVSRSGLRLFGGYASGFSNTSGFSILDAELLTGFRVIHFSNANDLVFSGFYVRRGTNTDATYPNGGGMLINGVNRGVFTNIAVISNTSFSGAGIALQDSSQIRISGTISSNFANPGAGKGGGIFLTNCSYVTNVVFMERNSANAGMQFLATGTSSDMNYLSGMIRDPVSGAGIDASVKLEQHAGAMTIENCVITNVVNHVIGLAYFSPYNNQPGLIIRSNIIGSQNAATKYQIWESIAGVANDVSNHSIYNNIFITNNMLTGGFYLDNSATTVFFNATGPATMNTPFNVNHDALVGGNVFQP